MAILATVTFATLLSLFPEAPAPDPYPALRQRDYDTALQLFRKSLAANPTQSGLRQDFAYTLLKVGDTEAARDQFEIVLGQLPGSDRLALEYAYLCYETRKPVEARRTFLRLSKESRDEGVKASAAQAFENVDRPLREGIARWRAAVVETPQSFSAHQELAQLAENRDEFALAAQHYEYAWRLRRDMRAFLLDLGRVWKSLGRVEESTAAWHSPVSWSPDGQFVAYADWTSPARTATALFIRRSDGSRAPVQLTFGDASVTFPKWSPDGSRIAYLRRGTPNSAQQLATVTRDGGNVQVLSGAFGPNWPDWAPSGQLLVYVGGDGMRRIYADGNGDQRFSTVISAAEPTYSRDGARIALTMISGCDKAIGILGNDGVTFTRITDWQSGCGPAGKNLGGPAWAP